jgi:hypothetical protein
MNDSERHERSDLPDRAARLTRRTLLARGTGVVGVTLLGTLSAAAAYERQTPTFRNSWRATNRILPSVQGVTTKNGWAMPIYVPAEHADFISRVLDPQEQALVGEAMKTSKAFHQMHRAKPASKEPATSVDNDIIDFKTAAAKKGIETGKIRSTIHPALADHVRREAVKFADELKRTA